MENDHFNKLQDKISTGHHVFIARNATVIGSVILEEEVSVWYNAVIRADSDRIHIGARTNIQDGCIIHVDEGVPVTIGEGNVIGHAAIIHGATIGDHNLIGMRSTIMNGARIGNYCIIGAHALVTESMEIPDYSLVLGIPAKIAGQVNKGMIRGIISGAEHYVEEAKKYLS